jgi:outer membrane protein assembly factor BamB
MEQWHRALSRVAWIAAIFCLVVFVLLLVNAFNSRANDPLKMPRLQSLIMELNRNPTDDALKARVRRLDQQVRSAYFRSRSFAMSGFYLLIGGLAVFLVALEAMRAIRRQLPQPDSALAQNAMLAAATNRRAVIALATIAAGIWITLMVMARHDAAVEYTLRSGQTSSAAASNPGASVPTAPVNPAMGGSSLLAPAPNSVVPAPNSVVPAPNSVAPSSPTPAPSGGSLSAPPQFGSTSSLPPNNPTPNPAPRGSTAPVKPKPTPPPSNLKVTALFPKTWEAHWPVFRGPSGVGLALTGNPPTVWNGAQGKGILWKTAIPLPGMNAPIVWGDRVFLSGADKTNREIYCLDARSGKILWKKPIPVPALPNTFKVSRETGYAPSTMVTDGKRVCAIFVTGEVVCLDYSGKQLWIRALGVPESLYGHASSLMLYGNGVIVQFDQGSDPSQEKSALLALDIATGKTVWQVKRPVPNSWSSPILIRAGKQEQIITCGSPWVIAYDPRNGREIWRAKCLEGDIAPSPAYGDRVVFACNMGSSMAAINPTGTGDITTTGIVWTYTENLPDTVSPISNGELVFLIATEGTITCLEAATGKKVWEHHYDTMFRASPILAGKTIYLIDTLGVTYLIEAGRAFKELGKAELGEDVGATPALTGNRLYIRAKKNLYCIGQ